MLPIHYYQLLKFGKNYFWKNLYWNSFNMNLFTNKYHRNNLILVSLWSSAFWKIMFLWVFLNLWWNFEKNYFQRNLYQTGFKLTFQLKITIAIIFPSMPWDLEHFEKFLFSESLNSWWNIEKNYFRWHLYQNAFIMTIFTLNYYYNNFSIIALRSWAFWKITLF